MQLSVTRRVAFSAMFAALAIVLKIYSLPVTPNTRLSFLYLPCFLSGIFLGPLSGFLVGAAGDLLGSIISPKGSLSPLLIINSGLIGFLMGVCFHKLGIKNLYVKIAAGTVSVMLIVSLTINPLAQMLPPIGRYDNFWVALTERLLLPFPLFQPIVVILNGLITVPAAFALKQTIFQKYWRESTPQQKQ